MEEVRRKTWEQRWEWPLTLLAGLFLGAYAWPILNPELPLPARRVFTWLAWATWAVFALDYLVRWRISVDRSRFLRRSIPDLAMLALPMLRPLRALRLVLLLGMLNRRAASSLRGRVAIYTAGSASLVILCAALAVLDAERGAPEANIDNFGDALWWAATTVTTVGYGDRYPTTGEGRVVAALLMLGGIALLGVVTASFASWLLDRVREVEQESQVATRRDLQAVTEQLHQLRDEVSRQRNAGDLQSRPPDP